MAKPKEGHMLAAKGVLQYLRGITKIWVFYEKRVNNKLLMYINSECVCEMDNIKNTHGCKYIIYIAHVKGKTTNQQNIRKRGWK